MRIAIGLLFILFGGASFLRAENGSALAALKLLPPEKASQLARIEARDGAPGPDRWYFVVYDSTDPNGLHEYVVAGGRVVASRAISQFAETIKPDEVLGAAAVKIDSDRLAKLAANYAQANNVTIGKIGYELKKETPDAVPVWKAICADGDGKAFATLALNAGKGTVISHEGFAVSPPDDALIAKPDAKPSPGIAAATPAPDSNPSPSPATESSHADASATPRRKPRGTPTPSDGQKHDPVAATFKHIGGKFEKFFTGHDSIDH